MSSAGRIADNLFKKHPQVMKKLCRRLPIQAGDQVCNQGEMLPTGGVAAGLEGRVAEVKAGVALVQWTGGNVSHEDVSGLMKLDARYEQPLPQLRTDFRVGDKVALGNGDMGKIADELVGPTGFYSFRVKITKSQNDLAVGRMVYATANGMSRQAGTQQIYKIEDLVPDTQVKIGGTVVLCETANSIDRQVTGLQRISSLQDGCGMLFQYNPPKKVAFHMGAVAYPIDIVFIKVTKDGHKVAKIMHNIQPNAAGAWDGPGEVSMVIEMPGGFCKANYIKVGTDVASVRKIEAQEKFQPNREDNYPGRTYVPMEENHGDRFRGRDLGDAQMENQQAQPGKYDQQFGYDPISLDNDPDNQTLEDVPAFRPSGSKVKP